MIRRLPAHPDEPACPFRVGEVYQRKLRGLDGRPSFRVTAEPRRQRLGSVTQREASVEEGYAGRRALEKFRLGWVLQHDRRSPWRTASDEEVLRRWRERHAGRDCWVVELDLVEAPRLLPAQREVLAEVARRGARAQAGRVLGGGDEYTSGITIDPEAEAVDPDVLARIVAGELGARAEALTSRGERRRMRRRRLFEDER